MLAKIKTVSAKFLANIRAATGYDRRGSAARRSLEIAVGTLTAVAALIAGLGLIVLLLKWPVGVILLIIVAAAARVIYAGVTGR